MYTKNKNLIGNSLPDHQLSKSGNHEVRGKDSVNDEYRNKVDVIRQLRPNYDINLLKEEVLSRL